MAIGNGPAIEPDVDGSAAIKDERESHQVFQRRDIRAGYRIVDRFDHDTGMLPDPCRDEAHPITNCQESQQTMCGRDMKAAFVLESGQAAECLLCPLAEGTTCIHDLAQMGVEHADA